ncbi:MAG: MATE family efflux transporter [Lachnospiraceae bacterium]|nr:MATE family efflux transporter [Lachnospiraceae bacterium]
MGKAPILSLMVKLGLPTLVAQLINILYNMVDRIYIGHIPEVGTNALTGVGVTLPIITIISAFSALSGAGGAPLAAIALGKNDREKAERIMGNVVTMLLFFSIILVVGLYIFKVPVLYAFGASDATCPYGDAYLSIYLIGTLFVQITLGLNMFITAQGRSKTAMCTVLIGAVLNIILDPIFIFGFRLGVRGAAFATILSQLVSCIWVLKFLTSVQSTLRIKRSMMKPDMKQILSIMALGVSPFIMQVTECMISVVFNTNLQRYGGDLYVGSLIILQSVMQLITIPVNGFNQGVQPIVSYNYGAGNKKRVKSIMTKLIVINVGYCVVFTMAVILFPGMFAAIFTKDAALLALVKRVLPIFVAGCLLFGLQMSSQTMFLGLGQAKISLFMALLRKVILLIPLAVILPRFYQVMGIYWAEPIADGTAAIICVTVLALNINKILSEK